MIRSNVALAVHHRNHGRRTLMTALLCTGVAATAMFTPDPSNAATKIYRTVDEQGNVVFTDVPPKSGEEGQAVDLNQSNTFDPEQRASTPEQSASGGRSVESWLDGDAEERDHQAAGYRSLSIVSPANDAPLRDNAGNVTVTAAVDPELQADHSMQVYLDGQLRQSGPTTSFLLTNVDRGTHQIELRIVDASGNTLVASGPSSFHLQRRSVILQPARGARQGSN